MVARRFRTLFALVLLVNDVSLLGTAFVLAYRLRVLIPWPQPATEIDRLRNYTSFLVIFVASNVLLFFLLRLYHLVRATSRVDELYAVVGGTGLGTLLSVAVASLTLKNSVFEVNLPRAMIIYAWLTAVALVFIGRWVLHVIRATLQRWRLVQDRVLVVGTGEAAQLLISKIQGAPYLGYNLLGVVGRDDRAAPGLAATVPVLGCAEDLPRLIEQHAVDEVIIAAPEASDEEMVRLIALAHHDRLSIKVFPELFEIMTAGVTIDDLGGLPLLSVRDVQLRGWKLTLKRGLDLLGSALGLVLISPFLLLVALLIKLDSPGPVFYVQERMGLDAKPFMMFKFRSMRRDADANGPAWTVRDDPRRTRLGALLRRLSIDELPNLINVLLGDMSLVGPRPEQPAFVHQFQQIVPRYMERHHEKAGMTGWAQVNGLRGDTSIYERTKYDLWYIENWSVWLDVKILIRTAVRLFFDRSAA